MCTKLIVFFFSLNSEFNKWGCIQFRPMVKVLSQISGPSLSSYFVLFYFLFPSSLPIQFMLKKPFFPLYLASTVQPITEDQPLTCTVGYGFFFKSGWILELVCSTLVSNHINRETSEFEQKKCCDLEVVLTPQGWNF